MLKRIIPALLIAALGLFARAALAQEKCDSAADFVVQAREQARPGLSREEIERVRGKLKSANSMCSASGDAWYYRYLYSRQLGDGKDADYALRQARLNNAEGLRRNYDPFAPVASAASSASGTPGASGAPGAPSIAAQEVKLPPVVREKWALVVGIGNFQYPGINPLKYTAKDAKDFAALLVNPDFGRFKPANVTLLANAEATTNRIRSEIERLSEVAKPEDLVVIYISTHGSPRELAKLDINYLITYDTKPDRLYSTSLPMIELMESASKLIDAQRVVVFLDTCFSGAATLSGIFANEAAAPAPAGSGAAGDGARAIGFSGSGVSTQMLSHGGKGAGRVIITASRPNESSWESRELQNGIFTYYLIQSIKQKGGMTPIGELFDNLRNQVSQRARAEKKVSQTPMMVPEQTRADIRIGVQPQAR